MLAVAAVAYLALLAVVVDFIGVDGANRIPAAIVRLVWAGAGVALAVISLVSAGLWLALAGSRLLSGRLSGLVRVSAVLFALAGLGSAGLELRGTTVAAAGAATAAKWAYSVRADPAHNRLVIKGPVGRRFGAAVQQGLAQLSDPVQVEIDSPGGLLDEALRAGRAISARPGASVVARHWCASACLIVLMSGQQRLADRHTQLGFHAATPLAPPQDALFAWSFARQRRAAEAYLLDRGAPADLVARADRIGPRRVVTLTAAQALDRGVLTGVLPAPAAGGRRPRHSDARPASFIVPDRWAE